MNEREAFEKWCDEQHLFDTSNFIVDEFEKEAAKANNLVWMAWQARAALASQEPVANIVNELLKNQKPLSNEDNKLLPDNLWKLYDDENGNKVLSRTSPQAQPDLQDVRMKEICYYALNRFIHDHDTGKKIFTNDDVENYTVEAMKAKG
jgi:hypothetical protein